MSKGINTKIIYEGDVDEDSKDQIKLNGIMKSLKIKPE